MKKSFWVLVVLFLVTQVHTNTPTRAALYWFHGVRDKTVSVCFVGDAVTVRPGRVQQIRDYIREFERAANIRFNYLGTCPAPTTQPDGNDSHDGDIRVIIPGISINGSGPVPGKGCPMFNQQGPGGYDGKNDGWGSWSNAPDELATNRPCLYNLKLGDDDMNLRTGVRNSRPWLNHTLHEFGHALGLAHEHARADENAGCVSSTHAEYHAVSTGYMTPYDKNSVMHYQFTQAETPTCMQIGSNYSDNGFTDYDRLALHILYPEDDRVAEFVGATVIRTGGTLNLQSAWKWRGANMSFVASNFRWNLNGVTHSTTPELSVKLTVPGNYTLELAHKDFLGRDYAYTGVVRVLDPAAFNNLVASISAINTLLLATDGATSYTVPVTGGTYALASRAQIKVGENVFTEPTVVRYRPLPIDQSVPRRANVSVHYQLEAASRAGVPVQPQPGTTYTVEVGYEQDNVPAGVAEHLLALYYWDDTKWVKEPTSVVDVFLNSVTATPNHFSRWAILAETEHVIYLPAVLKP